MAIGYKGGTFKLVEKSLLNTFNQEVLLVFDTCEFCGDKFIGIEHNDPGHNPIELAITDCGNCPDDANY